MITPPPADVVPTEVDLGPALRTTATTGAWADADRLVIASRFAPITVTEIDLATRTVRAAWTLPVGYGGGAWGLSVSGRIAVVGSYTPGNLIELDLDTGAHRLLCEPPDIFVWSVGHRGSDIVAGTYEKALVAVVDGAGHDHRGVVRTTPSPYPDSAYVRSVSVSQDRIFAGGGTPAAVFEVEAAGMPAGVARDLTPAEFAAEAATMTVKAHGSTVAAGTAPRGLFGVIDSDDPASAIVCDTGQRVVEMLCADGEDWFLSSRPLGKIFHYHSKTGQLEDLGEPVRGAENRVLWKRGSSLCGVTGCGLLWELDLDHQRPTRVDDLSDLGLPKLEEPLQSLLPVGNDLHIGGHFRVSVRKADAPDEAAETFFIPGEPKRMVHSGEWVVAALYPTADVWRYRVSDPQGTLQRMGSLPSHQTRPFGLAVAADGSAYVASQPEIGTYGGALSIVRDNGEVICHRNLIDQHSFRCVLALPQGHAIVGSDREPGLGAPVYPGSAVIARVVAETGHILWQTSPVDNASRCQSLVHWGDQILGTTENGTLFSVSASDGAVLRLGEVTLEPTSELYLVGDSVVASGPHSVVEIDPSSLTVRRTVAAGMDGRWYTVPQIAVTDDGALWTLRGSHLVRRATW